MKHSLKSHFSSGGILEEELAKPYQKRDYDKIETLLEEYTVRNGMEEKIAGMTEQGIQKAVMKSRTKKSAGRKHRSLVAVIILAAVLITANAVSVSAADENIFSVIVNFTKDGFSVDFFSPKVSAEEIIKIPCTENDPYGIIAKCAENGIYPETPHYLPEDYILTLCDYRESSSYKRVIWCFKKQSNKKQYIVFSYDLYEDVEQMAYKKYPNVEHNLKEIQINGKAAILAEEKKDDQIRIVYHIGNLLVSFFLQGIPKNEADRIINSIY